MNWGPDGLAVWLVGRGDVGGGGFSGTARECYGCSGC